MKKYDLILGIILLAGMVTLISGVEQLRHAVKIAIQKEAEEVERIITEATDKLTMSSLKKENIASYNMDDSEFFFVIDGEEIKKKVSADVSTHWVTTAPFYDVRDTSKWTLGALDGKIRGLAGEQAWKGMRIKLAKRDSAGRTLHVHEAGEVEWGMVRHFEEELGVLSKNRIEAEYTLPYRVVWADVRERASYWGIIALLLGGCWYATYGKGQEGIGGDKHRRQANWQGDRAVGDGAGVRGEVAEGFSGCGRERVAAGGGRAGTLVFGDGFRGAHRDELAGGTDDRERKSGGVGVDVSELDRERVEIWRGRAGGEGEQRKHRGGRNPGGSGR